MAPPVKKRRLSKSTLWDIFSPERHMKGRTGTATLSHGVQAIDPTKTGSRASPTKVHVEIRSEVQRDPVYPIPGKVYGRVGKRQDATGVTTDSTDTTMDGTTGADDATSTTAGGSGNAVSALAAGFSTPPVLDTSTNTTDASSAPSTTSSATVGTAGLSSSDLSSTLTSTSDTLGSTSSNSTSAASTGSSTKSSLDSSTRSSSDSTTATDNARSSSGSRVATISVQEFSSTDSNGATSVYFVTASPADTDDALSTVYSTAIISPTTINAGAAGAQDSSSTSSASLRGGSGGGSSSSPPASTVAGGVVGGVAGLAVIVLLAMFLLRWYRRRHQKHLALAPGGADLSRDFNEDQDNVSRGPGMAERAGIMPLMNTMPGMFRHQDRSVHDSASASVSASAPSERGFTRVTGRKLPSAFSDGIDAPSAMPLNAGSPTNMSNTSFYRDSDPFVDQPDSPPSAGFAGAGSTVSHHRHVGPDQMTMSPGPARKATVHHGGPYVMSPSSSTVTTPLGVSSRGGSGWGSPPPMPGTAATWGQMETPASPDGSRGSRFMEGV